MALIDGSPTCHIRREVLGHGEAWRGGPGCDETHNQSSGGGVPYEGSYEGTRRPQLFLVVWAMNGEKCC